MSRMNVVINQTRNVFILKPYCGIFGCYYGHHETIGICSSVISSILTINHGNVHKQFIHTSRTCKSFWEKDMKGGYKQEGQKLSRRELIRDGLKELQKELELWKDEVTEKLKLDPIFMYRLGEVDIVWKFDKPESFDQWVTTSDHDHGEGFSKCELVRSRGGNALFSGVLNTKVPKDGRIKKAGYCNMKSLRIRKSFKRDSYYDWRMYTHLVMRVRGDGRSYILNLATTGYFDILWNDVYHYVLYTRGGPYWQIAKIPFSKFFLASKGRVQDKQCPIPLDKVTSFGISAGDKIDGPFQLEVDYIGLEFDPNHREEFAYEMYKTDKYIVGH
ncbi:complex I intermediate-associated protein 30, mitochondrial [Anabrus simplex]|uniref:complex I intermediate-associated protein 30, mitochondrial n=1 Tax=Anabrus simplex TaxID=316456 RepID=UPI0034DCD505